MALVPTLTLNDTTTFSDTVNFSITDSLTVTAPAQSLSTIVVDTTGANNIIVPAADAKVYTFIRHTGTTDGSTGTSQLLKVETTGDVQFGSLKAGEFMFLPHYSGGSTGVQLESASGSIQVEYAYWTVS
jgi:hypothetical protein